ncbi:MAG TPA: hypothetical protein VIQ00_03345 [Chitinophagaceae bacterium]|jgi:hypothetical protein
MKKWFFIFLLFPFVGFSQDCKLKKETDDFTHETKITTGFVAFNETGNRFLLSIDANSKDVDFFFALPGNGDAGCFDNSSTSIISFEGSKVKSTYRNTGSMNCEGMFHVTFRNVRTTPSALNKLATLKISSINFKGNGKPIEIKLKDEEKIAIMQMAKCLVDESKTLLK